MCVTSVFPDTPLSSSPLNHSLRFYQTLLNRLRLRAVHSDLVQAHTKAQEQLRIAGSRRDLPRWDEDKKHRAKLRGDFVSLQNRIALSRRPSWAVSQSSSN